MRNYYLEIIQNNVSKEKMNVIINKALKDEKFIAEDFRTLTFTAKKSGFRFGEHFNLLTNV